MVRKFFCCTSILSVVMGAAFAASAAMPDRLGLEQAAGLALQQQPLLEAERAAAQAARAEARAAAQLPDPSLQLQLMDVPATGPERWQLAQDPDTRLGVALRQQFPAPGKRHWRSARALEQARQLDAMTEARARAIWRDAALAWLLAWHPQQAVELVRASVAEAALQLESLEIAYRAGRATLADVLAQRVELERLRDREAELEQREWHGRNLLSRWIGEAAQQPLHAALPQWPAPEQGSPEEHARAHPHLRAEHKAIAVAEAEVALARAAYRPDWSLALAYGRRQEFPDMAGIEFELELPFFTGQRQDQRLEAARQAQRRAEQMFEDAQRQHFAAMHLNYMDWERLQARLQRYDTTLLPAAQQGVAAALAAYRSGQAPLAPVLQARQVVLDLRLERLDLELDAMRHRVELRYYSAEPLTEAQS